MKLTSEEQLQLKQIVVPLLDDLNRLAIFLCNDINDAEEIVAETVRKACESFRSLSDIERTKPWLIKILRNTFVSHCRCRQSRPTFEYSEERHVQDDHFSLFTEVSQPFLLWWGNPERELLEDRVLDIGCGSGTDLFVAALRTGPEGEVFGVDMTDKMLDKVKQTIKMSGAANIHVEKGEAEQLPWEDHLFDVVTSNGVLNLVPDKESAFREIVRVLKPGGQLQISDIALKSEISDRCRMNAELWAECIVGAVPVDAYLHMLEEAGLQSVSIIARDDYFRNSPNESTRKSAEQFQAISITIHGVAGANSVKGADERPEMNRPRATTHQMS